MTDHSIDEIYEDLRAADMSDDAMGEVRRLVALDKAIECAKLSAMSAKVGIDVESTLYDARAIDVYLATGMMPGEDEPDDCGDLQ